MILNRLHELAVRKCLLDDPAFEKLPVPFVVVIGEGGHFGGITENRGETITVKKTKRGESITKKPDAGKICSVPRPHGNTASQGFARFLVDTLPRVLPVAVDAKDQAKFDRSRETFWTQIDQIADATDDAALRALQAFGRLLTTNAALGRQIADAVAEKKPESGDRVTFTYQPDGGTTILERPAVRAWFSDFYRQFNAAKQEGGQIGFCTLTGSIGPLPTSHPIKLTGIPGGLATGVSIVSFDKAAFRHYGLDGAANAAIGVEGADAYARAFQWLRAEKKHHFIVGDSLFLFWTREDAETDFMNILDSPDPNQVRHLLESAAQGKATADSGPDDFYLLAISGNSARAIVRDYLERPLEEIRTATRHWFEDLRIADNSPEYLGSSNSAFPLKVLCAATASRFDMDKVSPEVVKQLVNTAMLGRKWRLPDSILNSCLRALRSDTDFGFRSSRMGLIKLCLNRGYCKENPMSPLLDTSRIRDRAYACGRLLAFLARCQSPKDFGASAQLVERFFSTASTSPQSVFPTLLRLNRHHIAKIRDDIPGFATNLEKELEELVEPFREGESENADFPTLLSLPEQGRFVLGFYHQRADYRKNSAEKSASTVAI